MPAASFPTLSNNETMNQLMQKFLLSFSCFFLAYSKSVFSYQLPGIFITTKLALIPHQKNSHL